jgi:hypothetical protein
MRLVAEPDVDTGRRLEIADPAARAIARYEIADLGPHMNSRSRLLLEPAAHVAQEAVDSSKGKRDWARLNRQDNPGNHMVPVQNSRLRVEEVPIAASPHFSPCAEQILRQSSTISVR